MEYRHLRYFMAVADELSFTRAAARLRVAQPHISREIRRLEDELDVTLFTRDRTRVSLTPAGVVFLEQAHRILASTSEAVTLAKRASRGETGRVRVGFSSSAGFGVLPDVVRRFRHERPDVELTLSEYNSDEQPELLISQSIDVGLLYPSISPHQDLQTESIGIDPLVVALPADHPLAENDDIALQALALEPWIFFRRSVASSLHDEILRACLAAGFAPRVVQEARKLATITSLAASGLGVSLVPATLARLRLPRMVYRPIAGLSPSVTLAMMWRSADSNPALPAFMDALRGEAVKFYDRAPPDA